MIKNRFLLILINIAFISILPWMAYSLNLFLPNEVKVRNFIIKINDNYKNNINIFAGDKISLPLNLYYPYLCFVSSFIDYKINNSRDKYFAITFNQNNNKIFISIHFDYKDKIIMPTKIIKCQELVIIDTNKLINLKNDKMVFKFKRDNYYYKQYKCQNKNILITISSTLSKFPIINVEQ